MPSATAPTPFVSSPPPASRRAAAPSPAGAGADDAGFGVYVHWPFCLSKCPYCDFNSHVREVVDQHRWRRALLTELKHFAARTPGRRVTSLFFGGGTPSLMDPATAGEIIATVRAAWPTASDLEITLEANPGAAEAERFAAFVDAGVNRLSVGVQALDDRALTLLGRRHGRDEAVAAVARARAAVPRYSFDLIYARPGQTVAAWRRELDEAIDMAGDHLSVYQLTVEPGTAFHARWRAGGLALPDEATQAALYETTQARLDAAGLLSYEISNHARLGGACRHNLTYWCYGDYVGVGPGAHGRLGLCDGRVATRQRRSPEAWLAAVERDGHGSDEEIPIPADDQLAEIVMMGLRLRDGIARERFLHQTGRPLEEAFPADRLAALRAGGFLELDGEGLRATEAGRQRLDAVLGTLLA